MKKSKVLHFIITKVEKSYHYRGIKKVKIINQMFNITT